MDTVKSLWICIREMRIISDELDDGDNNCRGNRCGVVRRWSQKPSKSVIAKAPAPLMRKKKAHL